MAYILEVDNLAVSFGGFEGTARVVDGVSLAVRPGEKVGLVGETGCGKSITIRAIVGVIASPPAQIVGDIRIDGVSVANLSPEARRRLRAAVLSMIPQDPVASLNPVFTVGQQLEDIIWWRRHPTASAAEMLQRRRFRARRALRQEALQLLQRVRLPDVERVYRSYPFQLSGGMRQRVLIAMALAGTPRLIIADEPGTALDVTTQDYVLRLLTELVASLGVSVLLVSHHLGVVRQVTDRVYVMYAGHIVETAPTPELFRQPLHPYTMGLLRSVPRLTGEGLGQGIDGMVPDYFNPPPGCRFAPRCPYAMSRCEQQPSLIEAAPGHAVACWLVESGGARGTGRAHSKPGKAARQVGVA